MQMTSMLQKQQFDIFFKISFGHNVIHLWTLRYFERRTIFEGHLWHTDASSLLIKIALPVFFLNHS